MRRKIEGVEALSPAPMQRLRRAFMRICRNGKTSGTALKRRRGFRLEIILRKKRRRRNAAACFQPISDIPSYGAFFVISESSATLSGNAITMRPQRTGSISHHPFPSRRHAVRTARRQPGNSGAPQPIRDLPTCRQKAFRRRFGCGNAFKNHGALRILASPTTSRTGGASPAAPGRKRA